MPTEFSLTDGFPLPPGNCTTCQEFTGRAIVTPAQLPMPTGQVQICEGCVLIMARLLGFAEPEDVAAVREENARLQEQLASTKEQLALASDLRILNVKDLADVLKQNREAPVREDAGDPGPVVEEKKKQ